MSGPSKNTSSSATYPALKAELRRLAESGNASAQVMLGESFVPPELPPGMKQRSSSSSASLLQEPSYPDALRWLRLASDQGSGEASEIVAQIALHLIETGQSTTLTAADATQYRRLAINQGYDLEHADVFCYELSHNSSTLTCADLGSHDRCPNDREMQQLRQAGVTGTLNPQGGASGSLTTITMHPADPSARALVILDHNVEAEQRLPLPRHASAIYLQQVKGWTTLPADGPVLDRSIVLIPGADLPNKNMVHIQNIDGSYNGAYCTSSISSSLQ